MQLQTSNIKNKLYNINLLFYFFSLCMLIIFLLPVKYTLPSADDFSYILHTKNSTNGRFIASIESSINFYKNWAGIFFATFLQDFVLSFYKLGIKGLHFLIGFNIILLFTTLLYFTNIINKYILRYKYPSVLYFFIILIGMNITEPRDTFYWAIGSMAYILYLSLFFLFSSFFINYLFNHSLINYILSIIIGAIIASSILPLSGIVNCFTLTYLLYSIKTKHNIKKSSLLFAIIFLIACITAFAPGNFVRHGQISNNGFHLFACIISLIKRMMHEVIYILRYSYMVTGIIIMILSGIVLPKENLDIQLKIKPLYMLIVILFLSFVFLFPVELGYNGKAMPKRVWITFDIFLTIQILLFSLYLGYSIKNKYSTDINYKYTPLVWLSLIFIFYVGTATIDFNDLNIYKIARELKRGIAIEFYNQGLDTISKIQNTSDTKVILTLDKKIKSEILVGLDLSEDPYDWINEAVAGVYNKESIICIYKNIEE